MKNNLINSLSKKQLREVLTQANTISKKRLDKMNLEECKQEALKLTYKQITSYIK